MILLGPLQVRLPARAKAAAESTRQRYRVRLLRPTLWMIPVPLYRRSLSRKVDLRSVRQRRWFRSMRRIRSKIQIGMATLYCLRRKLLSLYTLHLSFLNGRAISDNDPDRPRYETFRQAEDAANSHPSPASRLSRLVRSVQRMNSWMGSGSASRFGNPSRWWRRAVDRDRQEIGDRDVEFGSSVRH
jgi:hypothetical protein